MSLSLEEEEDALEIARLDDLVRDQRAEGNLFDMLKTMESSLVLRKEMLGVDSGEVQHLGELLVREYNAVAMQCLRVDMFDDVHELLKKAYVMTEEDSFFQDEHIRLRLRAISHNNLGCLHKQRGKLTVALRHLEKAVQIELRTPDPDNPAGTHLNLCAILSLQGDHRRALHHAQLALGLLEKQDAAAQPTGSDTDARSEPPHELYPDWSTIEEVWAANSSGQQRVVREALTQSVFEQLHSRRTALGITLDKCIQPDMSTPQQEAAEAELRDGLNGCSGVVAGDGECYTVFGLLFEPLIEQLHFGFPKLANHASNGNPQDVRLLDLDPDFVQSVSVRLVRNIVGFPYAPSISASERKELDTMLTEVFAALPENMQGQCDPMDVGAALLRPQLEAHGQSDMLEPPPSALLVECAREWPESRSVFYSKASAIHATTNGLDHLTLCAAEDSPNLVDMFGRVIEAVSCIESQLEAHELCFDQSDHLGYLTTQPEMLGTGMKAQIILKLPLLAKHDELVNVSYALAVRIEDHDGALAVSNLETLGKTEAVLISQLLSSAAALIGLEKELSNSELPLKVPRAVSLGHHKLPAEGDNATMLPVAYHNLGAEYEHLRQFDEAVVAFSKAVKVCKVRLGVQSEVTKAMQKSLLGAKKSRKMYNQNPQGYQVATARTHRPVVPLSSRSRSTKKTKRKSRRVKTARRHEDQGRQHEVGEAYERGFGAHGGYEHDPEWSRELMPQQQDRLSLPPLCWPQEDNTALAHKRKEWERLPWNHVGIDDTHSLGPKEHHNGNDMGHGSTFRSPPPAPPAPDLSIFKPAPPPRLPAGTLYRPARRPGKQTTDLHSGPAPPPPPPPPH